MEQDQLIDEKIQNMINESDSLNEGIMKMLGVPVMLYFIIGGVGLFTAGAGLKKAYDVICKKITGKNTSDNDSETSMAETNLSLLATIEDQISMMPDGPEKIKYKNISEKLRKCCQTRDGRLRSNREFKSMLRQINDPELQKMCDQYKSNNGWIEKVINKLADKLKFKPWGKQKNKQETAKKHKSLKDWITQYLKS